MEHLIDPLNDRVVSDVTSPPHRPLDKNLLFPQGINAVPNWQLLRTHLHAEGRVTKQDALIIIHQATECFRKERNLLELKDPVTVVGDIHGQFYDFIRILELGGDLERTKYLFLGDYVDRGAFSLEVILLLYSIKLNYPKNIFMIRGNHECRQMTAFFNFRAECLAKYDLEIYDAVMDSFDGLPLACIVNNKFIAIHGGISPELTTLEDISRISRFTEPPRQGLFCDLLWSDPVENDTGHSTERFKLNEVRGCSIYFGQLAVNTFLKRNRLLSVLRAHEAQLDGYKMHRWNGNSEFPCVITVFSAPNYCDVYNNKGAMLKFENNTLNIQQFNYTEHPYILPNFLDVFSWSAPFVIEKVLEIFHNVLKGKNEPTEEIDPTTGEKLRELQSNMRDSKLEKLKNKVKAVSRMIKMFKVLREDKEIILQLKGLCPDNKVPKGLLSQGRDALTGAVESFGRAKEMDIINEKRPD